MASWVVKALVEATPISGTGQCPQHRIRLASQGALGHVHHREAGAPHTLHVTHGREGIGGLTRLGDEQAHLPLTDRRLAVAKLRADVPIDSDARQLLEPVAGDQAGIRRRAAGDRREARNAGEIEGKLGKVDLVGRGIGEGAQGVAQDSRLFEDLLFHEMAMIALADHRPGKGRLDDRPLLLRAIDIDDTGAITADEGDIALLEILDALGEWRQSQRVGADEHLAIAIADRQRTASAGGDQQLLVAFEEQGEAECPLEPPDGRKRGFLGCLTERQVVCHQMRHDFGVRLGVELMAMGLELVPKKCEILDDAIMDDRDPARGVRVGIGLVGNTMGGPARMADPRGTAQRPVLQEFRQTIELAFRPPPLDGTTSQRRYSGTVIASIFQPAKSIHEQWRRRPEADTSHNPTHATKLHYSTDTLVTQQCAGSESLGSGRHTRGRERGEAGRKPVHDTKFDPVNPIFAISVQPDVDRHQLSWTDPMRDLMLERFLDFLEDRHGASAVEAVLDEMGMLTIAHQGLGVRGQRLRSAAAFAATDLAIGCTLLLREFGAWLSERHFSDDGTAMTNADARTSAPALVMLANSLIGASDAVRWPEQHCAKAKFSVVYRDEAGFGDIVHGIVDAWVRQHIPNAVLERSELSDVAGTHVRFCLRRTGEERPSDGRPSPSARTSPPAPKNGSPDRP